MDRPIPPPDPAHAVYQIGGTELFVTLADAEAMRAALLDQLKQSSVEERDQLLGLTEKAAAWIDPDGYLRIGRWLLETRGSSLVLTFRLVSEATILTNYIARLETNSAGWSVTSLDVERALSRS